MTQMARHDKQRGTAIVEYALILFPFLLLVFGGMLMLMASYTFGNVNYVTQQVAQCRADDQVLNAVTNGNGASTPSPCDGPIGGGVATTYANSLGTNFNQNPGGNNFTVTETQGTPCPGCIQEQDGFPYTPFVALIPPFTMNQTSVFASTAFLPLLISSPGGSIPANSCLPMVTQAGTGIQAGMVANANPTTAPVPGVVWTAYVDPGGGQVDLNVCNITSAAVAAPAANYYVQVIP